MVAANLAHGDWHVERVSRGDGVSPNGRDCATDVYVRATVLSARGLMTIDANLIIGIHIGLAIGVVLGILLTALCCYHFWDRRTE